MATKKDTMESNHGKVGDASSNKSATMKKELLCRYCDKKFTNHQALGGHNNAHKAERAAEKQNKILGKACGYYHKNYCVGGFVKSKFSNHAYAYGYGGKTLGVSPMSMTRFKPLHYMGVTSSSVTDEYQNVASLPWPWHHNLMNHSPQPTMPHHFMPQGSGIHQNHKSYEYGQPLISSIGTKSGSQSQPHNSLDPILCNEGNFGQASNSSLIIGRPAQNSSSSISMLVNGGVEKLDLTLKL